MTYAATNDAKAWRNLRGRRVLAAVAIALVSWVVLAALTGALFQFVVREGQPQPQDKFEAAIRNRSTSPSVILLTVVDDRTGRAQTGCAMAPFLLGAIERETGITSQKELEEIALANTAHVFSFKKQEAIDNILPFIQLPPMCAAVRRGLSVTMNDGSGKFMVESTGENFGWAPQPPVP
jgi:hypothetical protein